MRFVIGSFPSVVPASPLPSMVPVLEMCAMAASTRRLPDSSGSSPSFWKMAVMCFSTLASERNSVAAMA